MRIPIIESTYTPRAQGSGQIATPMASTIGAGLQQIGKVAEVLYQDRANDMQEQIKANQIIAQSKWQNQMFETKKKLTENIDTDGDYASARDRWQAESEKLISGIEKQKDLDPTWKESVIADLRRDQIQSDFQIGAAIKQRRKSEVASAANLNATMATERFIKGEIDQAGLAKALGGAYGAAAGVGAIDGNEATLKMRNAIGGAIKSKASIMVQNGDISAARDLVEASKDSMPLEDYISMRGAIIKADDAANTYKKAVETFSEGKKITPAQADIVYQDMASIKEMRNGQLVNKYTPAEVAVEVAQKTNIVPPSVVNQMQSYTSINPDQLKPDDVAAIYDMSQGYKEMPSAAKQKFDKKTQVLLNSVAVDTAAGVPVETAIKQRLASLNEYSNLNGNTKKAYYSKALEGVDFADDFQGFFDWNEPTYVPPEMVTAYSDRVVMYRSMGHEASKAQELAKADITTNYGVFDGQVMRAPPTQQWQIDEGDLKPMIVDTVKAANVEVNSGRYTLMADRITHKEVSNNLPVTYPVYNVVTTEAGAEIRQAVLDGKGQILRMAEPKVTGVEKFKTSIQIKGQ